MPYQAVRLSVTNKIVERGSILHGEARRAAAEAAARQLRDPGTGNLEWGVLGVDNPSRLPVMGEVPPQDVEEALVKILGVSPDEAKRLVKSL